MQVLPGVFRLGGSCLTRRILHSIKAVFCGRLPLVVAGTGLQSFTTIKIQRHHCKKLRLDNLFLNPFFENEDVHQFCFLISNPEKSDLSSHGPEVVSF
jgi:hypothetical protein